MTDQNSRASETLDKLRERQRRAWQRGERLLVESLASAVATPLQHNELQELVIAEVTLRRQLGETFASNEYLQRFPQLAEALEVLFAGHEANDKKDSPLAETHSFVTGAVDQSQTTIIQPTPSSISDPYKTNSSGLQQESLEESKPPEAQRAPEIPTTVTYISSNGIGVQQKGRYRLDRILGEGAFGQVYLGFDTELQRQVAIKVPKAARFQKPEDALAYLEEARTVARLDHPNIVSVYDTGRIDDGSIYVVSRFVNGSTLQDRIDAGRPTEQESARLLATVALALAYAHQKRLIHRDIKPANILIENSSNTPFVADFGLAVREEDYLKQSVIAGTPAYMSPEQIRGEGHRLDGRSDIFSLGVILYQMLTTKRPFRGSTTPETLRMVLTQDPRPPRELLDTIPAELERICLKALSKRASDRYANAADFAEDLEQWLKPTAASTPTKVTTQVVPKGLRSFDANDADFFLELLPGQRNRDGLPESIAFWKQRIEQTDPEQTFSVGLIYGPSGCGKSSLVKAGLLPHLSKDVVAVYVEATAEDTETRILRGLRKRLPGLSGTLGLADTLATLRRGHARKVVIIIDQFEQWLHAHRVESDAVLVKALRQCDGGRVQAIVMVRDDFAMAAARFMDTLDVCIVQGHNFATVDLFDVDHAAKVLAKFGQAFGRVPANAGNLTNDEQQFVRNVVEGLAQDGKVVSVRLALFAEMVKGKSWTAATLAQIGGTQGVGVNFLEETFDGRSANPDHRRHAAATRSILRAMLPELGTDIKGHMRSQADLVDAAGYQDRPSDLAALLHILDGELRLITPTDPEGQEWQSKTDSGTQFYQLAHDYLVPSLREWLTRKQKETRRGRAELNLAERSAVWNAKQENRHLPSIPEWLSIRTLTDSRNWTGPQRTLMNRAFRVHGLRTGMSTALLLALIFTGLSINKRLSERQDKLLAQKQEEQNQAEATRMVQGLLQADTTLISTSISDLKGFRTWADPQLKQAFDDSAVNSSAKLHAALALLAEGQAADATVLEFLRDRLLTLAPGQFSSVRELLKSHKLELIPSLWQLAVDETMPAAHRFHAACALADFDPSYATWSDAAFTKFIAEQLLTVNQVYVGQYQELLRPASGSLVPALSSIFKDTSHGEAKKRATTLLADYAAKDPETLTELVLVADATSDKMLFPILQQYQETAVKNMEALLDRRLEPEWKDTPLNPAWTEPSVAVRAKMEEAHGMINERFAFCQDMPWDTFLEVVESLRSSGYRPTRIRPHSALLTRVAGEGDRMPDKGGSTAAIWTRDGLNWQLQPTVTKSQLPAPDAPATKDGMLLTDLAALPSTDPAAEPQFVAVWSEPKTPEKQVHVLKNGMEIEMVTADEQRRVLIDGSETEITAAQARLTEQGFNSQSTISVRTDNAGQRRYTAIVSNQGGPSELRPSYSGFELVDQPHWDMAVAPAAKLPDPLGQARQQLAQIEKLPPVRLDEPQIREIRAIANYELGNLDAALVDLDFLISKEMTAGNVLLYRTLTLARLGKAEEAKASLEEYLVTDAPPPFKQILEEQVPILLDEFEMASALLESAVSASGQNENDLFTMACAAALRCKAFAANDEAQSKQFADRTITLLQQLVANGYKNGQQLKADSRFASFHSDPRFLALLDSLEPREKYAALWRADVEFESKLLAAVPTTSVVDQLKPLLAEGWRAFAIAVDPVVAGLPNASTGIDAGRPSVGGSVGSGDLSTTNERLGQSLYDGPLCTLILHRPLIPDAKKETLALQQAAAATALLRLNATDKVWPLFQDQPDPRLRSYLLHRLARYNIDPQSLITHLAAESNVTRRRSLIIGLGEFAKAKLLTTDQQVALTTDLAKRYAEDPDSGVHGATEWALKQLGATDQIANIRTAFSTGAVIGDRHWYLTKTGQSRHHSPSDAPAAEPAAEPPAKAEEHNTALTFAILDANDEFMMGSPVSEAERIGGPTGKNEIRHRRRIGRRFAIGTHEITVAQFKAFRQQHALNGAPADELDDPENGIRWYDAAAYCNWLSEQEGIPREQWCYDPAPEISDQMSLVPDYLQRTGYRLPSEAEWEYACRAGTTTARYFGETERLLGEYAWSEESIGSWGISPVGTHRPNGAGLFDMLSNVAEWCQDAPSKFATDSDGMVDKEQAAELRNSGDRVLRGGSLRDGSGALVRSALRDWDSPGNVGHLYGFRVSRTLKPVPLTAVPPAASRKN